MQEKEGNIQTQEIQMSQTFSSLTPCLNFAAWFVHTLEKFTKKYYLKVLSKVCLVGIILYICYSQGIAQNQNSFSLSLNSRSYIAGGTL